MRNLDGIERLVSGKMLTDIQTSTMDEGIGVGWILFVQGGRGSVGVNGILRKGGV